MRDYIDSHREVSPLRKANDAIVLDNTTLSEKEQFDKALSWVRERKRSDALLPFFTSSNSTSNIKVDPPGMDWLPDVAISKV
jgi:hypothetical protein